MDNLYVNTIIQKSNKREQVIDYMSRISSRAVLSGHILTISYPPHYNR